jgi:4-aminobutyrate aminotransferase/(S)-3-amino-2-methylpropionate transaminase
LNGEQLPRLITNIPGPASRQLAARLRRVESPNITSLEPGPPIFWQHAHGANVRDVDGNVYIDLTSGFGVANAGHSNDAVIKALSEQAGLLAHALGDVYPAEIKVRLLERIAEVMPGQLDVSILGSSGAEAVEAALKTAVMRTGRTGVLAFQNSYHGLTYGALATTHRSHFRDPFKKQLFDGVRFARFPERDHERAPVLAEIDALLEDAESTDHPIGCIIVEPIQGRGGVIIPPDWFLNALRERCDAGKRVLIFDEIYVGWGRTGRWLACEQWNVIPDVAVIGKGLSGALPISAAVGTADVMSAWPPSTGEAIHTSTFIGNPIACAAALAQMEEIESKALLQRARDLGARIHARTSGWRTTLPGITSVRGLGLIQAVELSDSKRALHVIHECMRKGVLLLVEGVTANILAITPPAVITEQQLDHALDIIEDVLTR